MMKIRQAIFGSLLAGLAAGAAPATGQFTGPALKLPSQAPLAPVPTDDPNLFKASLANQRIAEGDVLTVHIFGSTEYMPTVKVSTDGTVQLPLIGVVPIASMTLGAAEDLIAGRLIQAGMYKDPQVTIDVVAAAEQFATVTGELHAIVPLVGVRRLLDVLASANASGTSGVTSNANISSNIVTTGGAWPPSASHVITIIRQGESKPIIVDLGTDPMRSAAANIVIVPHDVIVISKVGVVYVIGAFTKQGAIPLDQNTPLTLLEATALSGGAGFEGRYEDLRIIRTEGLERKVVKVDVKKVLRGNAPDPVLQAEDIVYLPTNELKAALKGNGIPTAIGLIDLLIYAFFQR